MKRRTFLKLAGTGGVVAAAGAWYWPDEGLLNPCFAAVTPPELLNHELVQGSFSGINFANVWDVHTHLIGNGDSGGGIWIHESMQDMFTPLQYLRYQFYLNASCADAEQGVDKTYVSTLTRLLEEFPSGSKTMLLAFDFNYSEAGQINKSVSPFSVPDHYAASISNQNSKRFEWIASINPYREDCVEALHQAVKNGARAVKWLPPVMGINPGSPKCDRFYDAMRQHDIPLLTHAGDEHAVDGVDAQALGNPLLLRRALEHGVRVIVAHCASQGVNADLDKGTDGPVLSNFQLFARMMDDHRYEKLLFGDISAMLQLNRIGEPIEQVVQREEWHPRLLNGSDYPLPGVMPLFSNKVLAEHGYISKTQAKILAQLRQYNPLLYDFVLKRNLKINGKRLSPMVFETRRVFADV